MRLSSVFKLSGALLAAGILFGIGERIGQWLLPAPDTRVVLCALADDSEEDSCVPLDAAEFSPPDDAAGPPKSPQVLSI